LRLKPPYKATTGTSKATASVRASRRWCEPGAEIGPKILPEPPAESEGMAKLFQALVGPAGPARYSERARQVSSPGKRSRAFSLDKRGGTARVSDRLPSPRVECRSVREGRELLR